MQKTKLKGAGCLCNAPAPFLKLVKTLRQGKSQLQFHTGAALPIDEETSAKPMQNSLVEIQRRSVTTDNGLGLRAC